MSKKHKHISAVKTTEQKAVQQSQQPQELTPQKLNRLLEKNPFAQLLGMELLEVREGYAYGRMRMDEHFTNIYGGMHGGCSYALADTLAGLAAGNGCQVPQPVPNFLLQHENPTDIYFHPVHLTVLW